MKILIIGDVYGKAGREALSKHFESIKAQHKPDFIIANGENITHGKSMNENHYKFLKDLGINAITMGNHTFFRKQTITKIMNENKDVIRPINYKEKVPGKGSLVFRCKGKRIRITNILGASFMNIPVTNPFHSMDELLQKAKQDIHIVDFHGEATAEKIAFALDFDGRVTAVVGTHTHVQTADNRILPNKTAFITDIGMTGPWHSVIGANPYEVIARHREAPEGRFFPARGEPQVCAVVINIDDETNKAKSIKRIMIRPE